MSHIDRTALNDALPKLRADFAANRALAQRACARALRLTQQTQAMRHLLEARVGLQRAGRSSLEREIWDAAAEEVVRAGVARDRALGVLAHELRQPLAAAVAAERLLAAEPDRTTTQRARAVLARQLQFLSELVQTLLDYSRVSLSTAQCDLHPLDLRDIVAAAIEAVEPAMRERHHEVAVDATLPVRVVGDAMRLRQAGGNLLHNAARYSAPGGRIAVSLSVDGEQAAIAVTDSGAGIAAEEIDHIFDPFVRGSDHGQGLGIGLALVRRIADLHGGTIAAVSKGPGHSSVFTLRLPVLHD